MLYDSIDCFKVKTKGIPKAQKLHNLPGHFTDKFWAHEELTDFDFKNSIYYVNVGEANHQCWEDSEIGISISWKRLTAKKQNGSQKMD